MDDGLGETFSMQYSSSALAEKLTSHAAVHEPAASPLPLRYTRLRAVCIPHILARRSGEEMSSRKARAPLTNVDRTCQRQLPAV